MKLELTLLRNPRACKYYQDFVAIESYTFHCCNRACHWDLIGLTATSTRFQYVKCQLDVLKQFSIPRDIRKALGELPADLDQTYDRILCTISLNNQPKVMRILQWLYFSFRPLSLGELAELYILDPEGDTFFDDTQRLSGPDVVLGYLPNLVTMMPTDFSQEVGPHPFESSALYQPAKIILAHFSIKEYLISERIRNGPAKNFSIAECDAHLQIAESSLDYHVFLSKTELATQATVQHFQLWDYAVTYWMRHLGSVPPKLWRSPITSLAAQIFMPGAPALLNLVRIRASLSRRKKRDVEQDKLAAPLYYAALYGLRDFKERVVVEKHKKEDIITAPRLTYFEKTKNILQLLLEAGADIDARGKTDETALGEAAFLGDKRLFKLILEQGPNINAVGGMFGTTLQAAAWHGNEDLVIMLLEKNADFNLQGGIFGNALQAAVAADARGIARHLFSFGARVDSPGEEWELLLQKIYEFGYSERILDRLRKFQENPRLYLGIGEHPIIIN
jgi:hypothetical protein